MKYLLIVLLFAIPLTGIAERESSDIAQLEKAMHFVSSCTTKIIANTACSAANRAANRAIVTAIVERHTLSEGKNRKLFIDLGVEIVGLEITYYKLRELLKLVKEKG